MGQMGYILFKTGQIKISTTKMEGVKRIKRVKQVKSQPKSVF